MENVKTKKCSKTIPVLLALAGGGYGLAGEGEIGGFLLFVAFFSFVFCKMVDSSNEVTSLPPVLGDEWFDQDAGEDGEFSVSRKEALKPDTGHSGAERTFFIGTADIQPTPSIFDSKQAFPHRHRSE